MVFLPAPAGPSMATIMGLTGCCPIVNAKGMTRSAVLVTRRIFPEAVAFLRERAEVEYVESDDALAPDELLARARGKQGIVAPLTDRFNAEQLARLDRVRVISYLAVGHQNVDLEAAP